MKPVTTTQLVEFGTALFALSLARFRKTISQMA
mgnify:CR=1 FL=1